MFTQDVIDQYVSELGTECPYCKSKNIEMIEKRFYEGTSILVMECSNCGKKWEEEYSLTTIHEIP